MLRTACWGVWYIIVAMCICAICDFATWFPVSMKVNVWCCSPSHYQIRTVAVVHSHMPNPQVETFILLDDYFFLQNGQITFATG